jgi:hypothetical protein
MQRRGRRSVAIPFNRQRRATGSPLQLFDAATAVSATVQFLLTSSLLGQGSTTAPSAAAGAGLIFKLPRLVPSFLDPSYDNPYWYMDKSIPPTAKSVADRGVTVIDSASIRSERWFPGFAPTGGILPGHSAPPETPESFAGAVQWSADFLNVVDKLPEAVFAYALVEFFILRPGIDKYREDIDEEPARAVADFVAVSAVRLAMFGVVAIVTTTIFGS